MSEQGLSRHLLDFINLNEFALTYHLSQLKRSTYDFDIHYDVLAGFKSAQSRTEINPNDVWDAFDMAMKECFQVAQVLAPAVKRSRPKKAKLFSKVRGNLLCTLLNIDPDGVSDLKDIRNRMIHFDEDFDDWYLSVSESGFRGALQMVQRALFWNEVNLHVAEQGILLGYDIKTGVFHTNGFVLDIHNLSKTMRKVRDSIPQADSLLTKYSTSRTELAAL